MPVLLIRHQRVDFERWHQVFLDHFQVRQAHGAVTEVILRNAHAPDDVWVLIEWDDLYRAQLFSRSDDLQDQLDQAGITLTPDMWFLEPVMPVDPVAPIVPAEGGDSPLADDDDPHRPDRRLPPPDP